MESFCDQYQNDDNLSVLLTHHKKLVGLLNSLRGRASGPIMLLDDMLNTNPLSVVEYTNRKLKESC
jgi:hypothetical protein